MRKVLPIKDINTINQIKQLYAKRGYHRDLLLFLLGINTGFNLTDLLKLNVGDVKNKYKIVLKNNFSIPLTKELQELVKIVCAERKSEEPLFINAIKNRLDRIIAFKNFKEIRNELALGNEISVGSFRKTFGYFHYQKYKDLSFLMWHFNQNSIEQTLEYIDVTENINLRFKEGIAL